MPSVSYFLREEGDFFAFFNVSMISIEHVLFFHDILYDLDKLFVFPEPDMGLMKNSSFFSWYE